MNNTVSLQLAQLGSKHPLRDPADQPLQLVEAKCAVLLQMKENYRLPAPADDRERCLNRASIGFVVVDAESPSSVSFQTL